MKIVRCGNGHFYNADLSEVCPYCGEPKTAERDMPSVAGGMTPANAAAEKIYLELEPEYREQLFYGDHKMAQNILLLLSYHVFRSGAADKIEQCFKIYQRTWTHYRECAPDARGRDRGGVQDWASAERSQDLAGVQEWASDKHAEDRGGLQEQASAERIRDLVLGEFPGIPQEVASACADASLRIIRAHEPLAG